MLLKLSLACWDYDRTKALEDGRVRPEGIELTFLNYRVEETSVQCVAAAKTGLTNESGFSGSCASRNSMSPSSVSLHMC
ncbi:hypothetical protein AUP68_03622 [Ilyonectria robusta]